MAIFGYPWLFFLAVAIFLAAGIFAVFPWLFFKSVANTVKKIAAWLFWVGARGYFSWLSVAIRGYPWLFFVFVAISNIPWLFFSWLFF